jgi:hypothetical protein
MHIGGSFMTESGGESRPKDEGKGRRCIVGKIPLLSVGLSGVEETAKEALRQAERLPGEDLDRLLAGTIAASSVPFGILKRAGNAGLSLVRTASPEVSDSGIPPETPE